MIQKPPVGAVVNPSNPLSAGLILSPLFNGTLWEPCQQTSLRVFLDPPTWGVNDLGDPCLLSGPNYGTVEADVRSIPFFQHVPTSFTFAMRFCPAGGGYLADSDIGPLTTLYSLGKNPPFIQVPLRSQANSPIWWRYLYTPGDWILMLVTVAENNCNVYVNGALVHTFPDCSVSKTWVAPMTTMAFACGDAYHGTQRMCQFAGLYDLYQLWANRVFTPAEAASHAADWWQMLR